MTADARRRVLHLLGGALVLPKNERPAFLDAQCASADERAQVEALLAYTSDPLLASGPEPLPAVEASRPVLEAGTHLSQYRIVRVLGAGGMGTVYLAFDERLNRDVAVKVLKKQSDTGARARLLREARAAAALDHPSICAVHEVGVDAEAGDFIVMQFVEGETLDDRLQQGPLRPREAVAIGRQLAEALSVAHARGIVHRDLKPLNVILDRSGRPRLLDFGIARALYERQHEFLVTTQVTDPLAIVGTPAYMCPEQVQGWQVDGRSDLFSLGAVIYECLTGTRAFTGRTVAEVCGRVVHVDPLPPSAKRPGLGGDYDALCMRLLAKEPAARFQSADEAVGAMRLLETGTGTGTPVEVQVRSPIGPSTRHQRRLLAGGAGALVVGLLALAVGGGRGPWLSQGLTPPPADARHWYEQGVEALRAGSYAGAVARLQEAVRLYPGYALAYSRLAEAHGELDNPRAAEHALIQVSALVPDQSALDEDERLRLTAVRASVLRQHADAEEALKALAARHPESSGALVDLARAQDAAGRWVTARETLSRAVAINAQDPSARLRLGVLDARQGQKTPALAALDESARLYRAAANVEGEAEALLRRGMVLSAVGDLADAQVALDRALALTADARYASQRLRARFELAAVTSSRGRFADAERMARESVDEATQLQLETVAANGLIDLADALLVAGRTDDANAQLERAFSLAQAQGAQQTAMRARLQQAALREATGQAKEAVAMAEAPRAYFAKNGYVRWDAVAKSILSRGHGSLGNYKTARSMAREVLAFAESVDDAALAATALENLAGVHSAEGQLPDALQARERIENIHRRQDDQFSLPFDMVNRAELLVRLGRGSDAEALLVEVDKGIVEGRESYRGRARRVAMVRALRAATEGRRADIIAFATLAVGSEDAMRDSTAQIGAVLMSYALACLRRPEVLTDERLGRLALDTPTQREVRYWLARSHAERRHPDTVAALVEPLLATAPVQQNAELRWRLAATAMMSANAGPEPSGILGQVARQALSEMRRAWGERVEPYLERADLAALHAAVAEE